VHLNSLKNPNHLNETNLLRSENFEESLEDIEAEAEICSPTKSISHIEIKQKKKSKNILYYKLLNNTYWCFFFFN